LYILREGDMQTRIQKWGNSLGLRIPRSFAAEAQVKDGAAVDLSIRNGSLIVRRLQVRKYALRTLLRKVNARNRHGEVATGEPVGREVW
jgi:antitoxin MazE